MSRYIDADALKSKKTYSHERHEYIVPVAEIDWMPTVDAVPVCRCRECKHWDKWACDKDGGHECLYNGGVWMKDEFCSDGERKDIELPIKQMDCNGEVISDELKADGTLVKRLGNIELGERKDGAE